MGSTRAWLFAGPCLASLLTACAPDLTGVGDAIAQNLFCPSSDSCSASGGSGMPDVVIRGHVYVGDVPVAAGGAEVQLFTMGSYPAPSPLVTGDGGLYYFSATGEVAAAVCGWEATARLPDGRASHLPLFAESPGSCSGELEATDFRFDP